MAKYTGTLLADGTVYLCDVHRPRSTTSYNCNFFAYGSAFGGGTVAFQVSYNGGTTKMTLKDEAGTNISATANYQSPNILLGETANNTDTPVKLYAVLSGSTNPNLTVGVVDNF